MPNPWDFYTATENKGSEKQNTPNPWDHYKNEEKTPLTYKDVSGDEIDLSDRALISFASNPEEKKAYLAQKYPGIEFEKYVPPGQKEATDVVRFPGEKTFKFINNPDWTMKDIGEAAGSAPAIAAGLLTGPNPITAGIGQAGAEGVRKYIGRNIIGIPSKQSLLKDTGDVAVSGLLGGLGQLGANKLAPYLGKYLGNAAKPIIRGEAEQVDDVVGRTLQHADDTKVQQPGMQGRGEFKPIPNEPDFSGATKPEGPTFSQETVDSGFSPKTMEDVVKYNQAREAAGFSSELPTAEIMRTQILPEVADLPQPLPGHLKALEDKTSQRILRTYRDAPTEVAKNLNQYEAQMKNEAQTKLKESISKIGKSEPTENLQKAGEQIMDHVQTVYDKQKEALKPAFERLKDSILDPMEAGHNLRVNAELDNPALGIIDRMKKIKDPNTGKSIEVADGITLSPFDPKKGLSKAEHGVLKEAIEALNSPTGVTFKDLQNIREFLRKEIDPANPKAWSTAEKFRGQLLDYMTDASEIRGGPAVRDTFKQYAMNEKNLAQFEKIIGGKIEHFDELLKGDPTKVINKMFKDPNTIEVSKRVLGEDQFNNAVMNRLSEGVKESTKDGILSSAKFRTFLDKNKNLVNQLPESSRKRIYAITDYMRMIADAPSANPSGTAASSAILNSLTDFSGNPLSYGQRIYSAIKDKARKEAMHNQAEKAIFGEAPIETILNKPKVYEERLVEGVQKAAPYAGKIGRGLLVREAEKGLMERDKPKR